MKAHTLSVQVNQVSHSSKYSLYAWSASKHKFHGSSCAWELLSVCTQSWSSQVRRAPFYTTLVWWGMWDNTRGAQIEVLTNVAQKYKLEPSLGPLLKCLHRLGVFSVSYANACPPHLHHIAPTSLLLYTARALMHCSRNRDLCSHLSHDYYM